MLGIWQAVTSEQIDSFHPIIGLVVFVLAITQPFSGLIHHKLYVKRQQQNAVSVEKRQQKSAMTYVHICEFTLPLW